MGAALVASEAVWPGGSGWVWVRGKPVNACSPFSLFFLAVFRQQRNRKFAFDTQQILKMAREREQYTYDGKEDNVKEDEPLHDLLSIYCYHNLLQNLLLQKL